MPVDILVPKVKRPKRDIPEPLPIPNFMMCVIAPPRSGKSVLLSNFITNPDWKYTFDVVIIVSPTALFDPSYADARKDPRVVIQPDPTLIADTIDVIIKSQDSNPASDVLLIIDDCVGFLGRKVETLSSLYRHHRISLIIASQQLRKVPPTCRTCAGYWLLFSTRNDQEIQKMNDMFSGQFRDWEARYRRATKEKYNFLFMDMNSDSEMYHNFNTII